MCKDDIADDDAAEDLLLHVALCWMMALKQLLLHAVCVKTMDAWISMQGRHRWGRTGQGPAATFCGMWHDGYVQHIFCLFVCVMGGHKQYIRTFTQFQYSTTCRSTAWCLAGLEPTKADLRKEETEKICSAGTHCSTKEVAWSEVERSWMESSRDAQGERS